MKNPDVTVVPVHSSRVRGINVGNLKAATEGERSDFIHNLRSNIPEERCYEILADSISRRKRGQGTSPRIDVRSTR